jgi:hypothetical protein
MLSSIPIELSIGVDGYQDAATDKVGASTGVGVGVEVPITIGVGVGASIWPSGLWKKKWSNFSYYHEKLKSIPKIVRKFKGLELQNQKGKSKLKLFTQFG